MLMAFTTILLRTWQWPQWWLTTGQWHNSINNSHNHHCHAFTLVERPPTSAVMDGDNDLCCQFALQSSPPSRVSVANSTSPLPRHTCMSMSAVTHFTSPPLPHLLERHQPPQYDNHNDDAHKVPGYHIFTILTPCISWYIVFESCNFIAMKYGNYYWTMLHHSQ